MPHSSHRCFPWLWGGKIERNHYVTVQYAHEHAEDMPRDVQSCKIIKSWIRFCPSDFHAQSWSSQPTSRRKNCVRCRLRGAAASFVCRCVFSCLDRKQHSLSAVFGTVVNSPCQIEVRLLLLFSKTLGLKDSRSSNPQGSKRRPQALT